MVQGPVLPMAMTDHKHMADPAGHGDHVHATDPVCGMNVDPQTAKHRFAYKGQDYFFCSGRCRERFEAEPDNFLQPKPPKAAAPAARSTPARCIRRSGRSAPALVRSAAWRSSRSTVSLDDKPDPELIDMTRRFWIALALTLPLFVLEMGGHLGLMHLAAAATGRTDFVGARHARRPVGRRAVLCARLALAGLAQSEHVHADRARHRRRLDLQPRRDAGAAALSRRPSAMRTARSRSTSKRPRSSPRLVLLGQVLELRARAKTSGAIKALLGLAPVTARRVDGQWR